jgi:hypothetical protein
MPVRAITAPIDRSKPPQMKTIVTPMESMLISLILLKSERMFDIVKKLGDSIDKTEMITAFTIRSMMIVRVVDLIFTLVFMPIS